jgi:glycosyltransferase involved in cell wall biosynthesis
VPAHRAAIIQDWLAAEAGSERCALEFSRLLPDARIFTTFLDPHLFDGSLARRDVRTWPLQRVPGAARRFRALLPLYPLWFSTLDARGFGLVISSSVAFSHAVRTSGDATHIAYVYTPLRYAWDLDTYLERSSWSTLARTGARAISPVLKRWDRAMARHPDVVVAISEAVQARIARTWGRDSEVIYPPVDTRDFRPDGADGGYYLIAARMLAYRRLDVAVAAATRLQRDLVVVGDGPERGALEALAGPSVRFTGRVGRAELVRLMEGCRAYLVPGIEDFGIAPVEAMAAGKPVIGIRAGGLRETVLDGETGVLFEDQSSGAMAEAMRRLDDLALDREAIRARAEMFSVSAFRARWRELFVRLGVDPSLYSAE